MTTAFSYCIFDRPFNHKITQRKMPPRTEQQFGEIRELRKTDIMQAGLELFGQFSIESTSIAMIAKKAGISKGLIYNYFESKESLIVAIVTDGLQKFTDVIPQIENTALSKPQLINYLEVTFTVLENNISYWKLYFSILLQPSVMKLVESQLMETLMPIIQLMTGYYKNLGYSNPMAHAMFLGATLDGISMNYMINPKEFPLQEIKNILIQKLL